MWMLVRANALGRDEPGPDGRRVLAACPDTAERGDPWRWSVGLQDGPDGAVATATTDETYVVHRDELFAGRHTGTVVRPAGDVLVVAVLRGEALVAVEDGPWERWVRPGDVFVLEGEDDELLRISLAGGDSAATVFVLSPTTPRALRWVP